MTRPIRTLTLTALAVLALAGFPGPAAGQVPADSASASMETRPSTHGPDRARLLLSSSAQPLQRGEGYVAGHLLLFPVLAFGVTDALTVAGGGSLVPGLIGKMVYLAPKLTVASLTGLDLAIASITMLAPPDGLLGAAYAMGTVGGSGHSVTAGAGWGYRTVQGLYGSRLDQAPLALLALQSHVIGPFEMLTENWLNYHDGKVNGLLTGGVRILGRAGSGDLALAMWKVERGRVECCLPIVNFTVYFGR